MGIWRLMLREVAHRKLNFALGIAAVCVAIGCLVGTLQLLEAHERRTDQLVERKAAETAARVEEIRTREAAVVKKMEDDIRKNMRDLGFNVLILPADLNLSEFYADDFAKAYMPEEYAVKLADTRGLMTINHILPTLTQKISWPERNRQIILIGTRGQVHITHRSPGKPIRYPVEPGKIELGHQLARDLGIKAGEELMLLGEKFTVSKVQEAKGTQDDIAAWIELSIAQRLLDKKGKINGILALGCNCASIDRLAEIESEVRSILGDQKVQVIEKYTEATVRAKARNEAKALGEQLVAQAKADGDAAVAAERASQGELRQQRERFATVFVPVTNVGCAVWLGMLALSNVRERRQEIGLLRALGVGTKRVLGVFLSRAALMGLVGGLIGYPVGVLIGQTAARLWAAAGDEGLTAAFNPTLMGAIVLLSPLVCVVSCWLPALTAAGADPAGVLRDD